VNERCDVLVIGAGPAGAVAAYCAAKSGADVLLVDKARFPRVKACGCCINARALATLAEAGLGGIIADTGARSVSAMRLYAGEHTAVLNLNGEVSLSRAALDAALARQAQLAGATFLDRTAATLLPTGDNTRRVLLRMSSGQTRHIEAGAVVAADGLAGTCLKDINGLGGRVKQGSKMGAAVILNGASEAYLDGVIHMGCGDRGYVGLVRLEDGRLNVAAALDAEYVRSMGGPGQAAEQIMRESGLPTIRGFTEHRWLGTPLLTRTRPTVAAQRLFILGDAAGYVEPFTGEGIAWAATSARVVAGLAVRAARCWEPSLTREWTLAHRALVRRRQWACRGLAALLRRPWLVRAAVRMLDTSPRLADPLIHGSRGHSPYNNLPERRP